MDKTKLVHVRNLIRATMVESPRNKTLHARQCNALRKPDHACSDFCRRTVSAVLILTEELDK